MSDDIDRANDQAERHLLHALALHRMREESLHRPVRPDGLPPGECVDCGNPIGQARLRAVPHASRCIHCQAAIEKQRP